MHPVSNANSIEYITQSYWLASSRRHDIRRWGGGMAAMPDVLKTFLVLRLNEYSSTVAKLADEAVQEMYARKGAVG